MSEVTSGKTAVESALTQIGGMRSLFTWLPALVPTGAGLPLSVRWDRLDFDTDNGVHIDIASLRVAVSDEPIVAGDMRVIYEHGALQSGSRVTLREPTALDIAHPNFQLDSDCFTLLWQDQNLNRWLQRVSADLIDRGNPSATDLALRVIFGQPRKEVRLDWSVGAADRTYGLPGVSVTVPGGSRFSLVWTSDDGGTFNRLGLILTVPRLTTIQASSNFAWGRAGERELHDDDRRDPSKPPLIDVSLSTEAGTDPISVLLFELPLDGSGAPHFFRQLATVAALGGAPAPCVPLDLDATQRLNANDWKGALTLNLDDFRFPFLRNDASDKQQFVTLILPDNTTLTLDFESATAALPVGVKVAVGSLDLTTSFDFIFNWETFGLDIDHSDGLQFVKDDDKSIAGHFLGLDWTFKGALLKTGPNAGKYHFLTLATQNYNYQIQQAPGSEFTLEYSGISEEPLGFTISDFMLRPQGLSLRARVRETPVRLRGIDTKFRFSNSGFEMHDSRITEFTLAGSGALPPALVGDSSVDIFLRFGERADGLTLIDGKAKLRGNKLLQCKGSRFEFSIDELGISFVSEGKFHLYFTLTGSAQFRLADGDETEGLLSWLPNIKIDMVDCPLAGDVSVLAKHLRFLITLPKPLEFSLLGCFTMELRGFGFLPQAPMFDGDGAMWLSGQIKFADTEGDSKNDEVDYHSLYIGLPEPGSFLPRIHLEDIVVDVKIADAFKLYAMVKFYNDDLIKGFAGEGKLMVSGLPAFEAAFAFVRARKSTSEPFVRAWFIAAQVTELSLMIPVIEIYIREIGFGLGYRYTLAMIKAADEERNVKKLLKALDELAKSQGELAKIASWSLDIGGSGDPRFTLVLRALISQTSASSPTSLNRSAEKDLACLFLFDAVLAFRSDLTFLITARGWINTNYVDYADGDASIRRNPFAFAYILLSPPQKRFLARMGTTTGGYIGDHPPLAPFMKQALGGIRFRATLLIEPGLFHLDLGWPNQLGWSGELGPIKVSITGGFIFRVSRQDLVIGVSYMARGSMEIKAEVSAGIAGVRVYARADVAYGTRFIGVLSFDDPVGKSLFYGAVGFELMIQFSIEFWLELLFTSINLSFSFAIIYSAAIEFGLDGLTDPGVRGHGTLGVKVCGRTFRLDVKLAINEGAVEAALNRTAEYMKLGLDADDTGGPPEPVPGTGGGASLLGGGEVFARRAERFGARTALLRQPPAFADAFEAAAIDEPQAPHYSLLAIPKTHASNRGWSVAAIFPRDTPTPSDPQAPTPPDPHELASVRGFLPVPPDVSNPLDFELQLDPATLPAGFEIEQFRPDANGGTWVKPDATTRFTWCAYWDAEVQIDASSTGAGISLRALVQSAFVESDSTLIDPADFGMLPTEQLEDDRVYNPSPSDFEAAVRGAFTQFQGAPFFKHDPNLEYDAALQAAFRPDTTIYAANGSVSNTDNPESQYANAGRQKHADQLRGLIVNAIVTDSKAYAEAASDARRAEIAARSLAFQMGLVFRFKGPSPDWLTAGEQNPTQRPTIRQRIGASGAPDTAHDRHVWVFNPPHTSFDTSPPAFSRVRHYSNASTIAIAWDLTWNVPPPDCVFEQADPEHHLAHYRVLRRSLDGSERDVVYTVKSAQVLHRDPKTEKVPETLKVLKPRFQIVDHFTRETPAEQAALPEEGRSYLYTITPVDVTGTPGRPLTLVAARFPDRPPHVPTDAQLLVRYRLDVSTPEPTSAPTFAPPTLLLPEGVTVRWSEQPAGRDETRVPVRGYRLLFRRSALLPVGSYALDSTTQRGADTLIGSAVARPLPSDIVIDLLDPHSVGEERSVIVLLSTLQQAGIFPNGTPPHWRPDSWDVFIQAIALNGVPSSLAPVQLVLQADTAALADTPAERQPAELEWLPAPQSLPLLPPEDQQATPGDAHFPMPLLVVENAQLRSPFDSALSHVQHMRHPAGIRCVRLRWNQGPSASADYPLDLTAGFHLLELDIDAATTDTFDDCRLLAEALRPLQEVRMVPADDLPFLPGDTLSTSQWEAWYPSAMQRRTDISGIDGRQPPTRSQGSQVPRTPWYSWRESVLEWPRLDINGEPAWRSTSLHPLLQRIVDRLDGVLYRVLEPNLYTMLNGGTIPAVVQNNGLAPLTGKATVRTVTPGIEWRIDDPDNLTKLYNLGDQDVFARQLRLRKIDTGLEVAVVSPYRVDLQQHVPAQQGTFADWLAATAPKADPYGWGVLQLLGLSTTITLRDARTARPILGEKLLDALKAVIDESLELPQFTFNDEAGHFKRHLFVEALFQPNRAVELDRLSAKPDALLAQVQLSLRPTIRQLLPYVELTVRGTPGAVVELALELKLNQRCDLVIADDPARGQQTFTGQRADPECVPVTVRIPGNGIALLAIRGDSVNGSQRLPGVVFGVSGALNDDYNLSAPLTTYFSLQEISGQTKMLRIKALPRDEQTRRQIFADLKQDLNVAVTPDPPGPAQRVLPTDVTYPRAFAPTDERSTAFTIPQDMIVGAFEKSPADAFAPAFTTQWALFKRYVDSIFTSAATKIEAPGTASDIAAVLPDVLSWSQRFFDANTALSFDQPDQPGQLDSVDTPPILGQTAAGPWLATAYPRSGTPAYATPDASGRLKYDHLLQDAWAHAFRYYIQPYARYERLMAALRDSLREPNAPATPRRLLAQPDPTAGGLDVVVDRVAPVAAPLVLYSGRLDELGRPDQPAPPGRTWEVIMAQHAEQALSERNQTLRRRLAFRQVAFTLMRRFAEPTWLAWLNNYHQGHVDPQGHADPPFTIEVVDDEAQAIPRSYPLLPDHIDLPALRDDETALDDDAHALRAAERRSLDLPLRIGRFQGGALVLQWEALPFYYEHKLLLIAQADRRSSAVSSVTQRDFEYRSPPPLAQMRGTHMALNPASDEPVTVRVRQAIIPLQRLWDSLPPSAQAQWGSENPGAAPYGLNRPLASLPDRDVVYQIVEVFSGNVEVQTELYYGVPPVAEGAAPPPESFIGRQLGKRVIASLPPVFEAVQRAEGDYQLLTTLVQYSEVPLSRTYAIPRLPVFSVRETTSHEIMLRVTGVLTRELRDTLLQIVDQTDQPAIEQLYDVWYSAEPVSEKRPLADPPAHVPDHARTTLRTLLQQKLVDFPDAVGLTLVWSGVLLPAQRDAIVALSNTVDVDLKTVLDRLIHAAEAAQGALLVSEPVVLEAFQKPTSVPSQISFAEDASGLTTSVTWSGIMTQEQADALLPLSDDPDLGAALQRLVQTARSAQAALVTRDTAPLGIDQLPVALVEVDAPIVEPPANAPPVPILQRLFVTHDSTARRYTALSWTGPFSAADQTAISAALDKGAQIGAFREAVARLFVALEAIIATHSGRVRPGQTDLPASVQSNLVIDDGLQRLRWQGDTPTPEQVADLVTIVADQPFVNAIDTLLTQLATPFQTSIAVTIRDGATPPPIPDVLAPALRLVGDGPQRTLVWIARLPDADQNTALATLAVDALIGASVTQLMEQLAQRRSVDLPAEPPPFQLASPSPFGDQLDITTVAGVTRFHWRGPLRDDAQRTALEHQVAELTSSAQYRALAPALQAIRTQLAAPISVSLDLPERPRQADLDASIRDQLLLGRFLLRYHGLMTLDEGQALSWLYCTPPELPTDELSPALQNADTRSVQRLYAATLQKGMRGRALKIRTRRANAAPSELRLLDAELLIPEDG